MKRIIISAVSINGVIGANNTLLWHIPEDLKFFKEKTTKQHCVVGYNTYKSLPEVARKNRFYYVVDGGMGVEYDQFGEYTTIGGFRNPEEAFDYIERLGVTDEIFVIGGAMLYNTTISKVDECYITWVNKMYDGDAFFPIEKLSSRFNMKTDTPWVKSETANVSYKFSHYVK